MEFRKVLIDTNVCLDVMTGREPYYTASAQVLQAAETGRITALVSADSFSTMYNVIARLSGHSVAIRNIRLIYGITVTGSISSSTVESAIHASWPDFEDALQYFCAVENGCDAVITRDATGFKRASVPVFTPEMFVSLMK